jgi:hypothetical protein
MQPLREFDVQPLNFHLVYSLLKPSNQSLMPIR